MGPAQLAAAKRLLEARFHAVLVTEWLDHPAQLEWPGDLFCYPTQPRVMRQHKKFGWVPFPNMAKKAAPVAAQRPRDWRPGAADLARLESLNGLDQELFEWAAARARRHLGHLNATAVAHGRAPFPPLPPLIALGSQEGPLMCGRMPCANDGANALLASVS